MAVAIHPRILAEPGRGASRGWLVAARLSALRPLWVLPLVWLVACAQTSHGEGLEFEEDPPEADWVVDQPPELPDARGWEGEPHPTEDGVWSYTDPGELPTVRDATGAALPLIHTDVDAHLRGHFAEVDVRQTFRNDASDVIEVVYTFPLPENAAVSHMRLFVGDRIVESEIRERTQARQVYDDALQAGHTAALLEQERPNVFTQSLANLPPGEDIDVEITYVQTLSYDAGEYEFVFPMVVGPRYMGGKVADAERISPPIVGEGSRRGDDFEIEVTAELGHPIQSWTVPTHEVDAATDGTQLRVALTAAETLPNRDFVLRYAAAGPRPRATMFVGKRGPDGSGHFAFVLQPPRLDVDGLVGRREFIFVVDRSGSMSGEPLALAKDVVRDALGHLRPVDTFDIASFESGTLRLFDKPRPANATNLDQALKFIDGMLPGGGTEMSNAVELALRNDVEQGRNRYVMFLTDGRIGFEDQIIRGAHQLVTEIGKQGQHARVFGVGIGASPNTHLLAALSRAGHGVPLRVGTREDPDRVVNTFARYVDHPIVDNVALQSGGLTLSGLHPQRLGDLFASHPIVAFGRYSGDATPAPRVVGTVRGKRVELPVRVLPASEGSAVLDALWARAAVADLDVARWINPRDEDIRRAITKLGLEHHIVTAFTSLVAVDGARVVGDGSPRQVVEPTITPDIQALAVERKLLNPSTSAPPPSPAYRSDSAPMSADFSASRAMSSAAASYQRETQAQARVFVGKPVAIGGRRAGGVRKAIKTMRPRLQGCYEASAGSARGVRLSLRFKLEWVQGGTVTVSVLDRGGADAAVVECVRKELGAAPLPKLKLGFVVTLPIRLTMP